MAKRILSESAWSRVEYDESTNVVVYRRSGAPFASVDEARQDYEAATGHVAPLAAARAAFLIDTRESPLRNDEAFEALLAGVRKTLFENFSHIAVLVRTATGRLQVARHTRDDGVGPRVFHDEEDAVRFLVNARRPTRDER